MIRRLFAILAFVLAAGFAHAAQIVVNSSGWTDLGPAPLNVMPQGSVYLYQGSAAPGALSAATLIGGDPAAAAPSMYFYGTAHVFAIGEPGALPVQVEADLISVITTQSVVVSNWPGTQAVSLASLPALAAGSNVIGAVTQSGGPWTVSWSGQSVAISNWPTTQAVKFCLAARARRRFQRHWRGHAVGRPLGRVLVRPDRRDLEHRLHVDHLRRADQSNQHAHAAEHDDGLWRRNPRGQ